MLKSGGSHGTKQQMQVPDHIKCGEVYTWLCADELYGVECKLCEDQPLCPLSEFPQHMAIWHTDWETNPANETSPHFTDDDEENEDDALNHGYTPPCTMAQLQHNRITSQQADDLETNDEILEPFEQVLIEQDITVDSTQNSAVVHEEVHLKDVKEQVAVTVAPCQSEKKCEQKQTRKPSCKESKKLNEWRPAVNEITGNERELQFLIEVRQSDEKVTVKEGDLMNTECHKNSLNYKNCWEDVNRKISQKSTTGREIVSTRKNINGIQNKETGKECIKTGNVNKNYIKSKKKILKLYQTKLNMSKRSRKFKKISKAKLRNYAENNSIGNRKNIMESETNNMENETAIRESEIYAKEKERNETESTRIETAMILNERESSGKKSVKASFENVTATSKNNGITENECVEYGTDSMLKDYNGNGGKHTDHHQANDAVHSGKQTELERNETQIIANKTVTLKFHRETTENNRFACDARKINDSELLTRGQQKKPLELCSSEGNGLEVQSENETNYFAQKSPSNSFENVKQNLRKSSRYLRKNETSLPAKTSEIEARKLKKNVREEFKGNLIKCHGREHGIRDANLNKKLLKRNNKGCLKEIEKLKSGNMFLNESTTLRRHSSRHCKPLERILRSNKNKMKQKVLEIPCRNVKTSRLQSSCDDSSREISDDNLKISDNICELTDLANIQLNELHVSANDKNSRTGSFDNTNNRALRSNDVRTKYNVKASVENVDAQNAEKEVSVENIPPTLNCSVVGGEYVENAEKSEKSYEKEYNLNISVTSWNSVPTKNVELEESGQSTSTPSIIDSLSPLSPKTEEEHFEFNEPKEKLNKEHISHLIKLYHEHPRLWDQSHADFCEPQICRKSWQQITDQWNEFCRRTFTTAEVRIRICTLCQRFLQERERLTLEGELDEYAKFPYYEQMQFLEKQKSLQKRRELYEQQNEKILEIYQHFPVLWHIRFYKLKQAKERAQAFESISKTLKLFNLHLSSVGVQKRIRSLRKCYRLEKIRHLHAQVEQTSFQAEFQHYERMQFLNRHVDPFVCSICGKIFENISGFRQHLEAENHGSLLPEESEVESEENVETQEETREMHVTSPSLSNDDEKKVSSKLNSQQTAQIPNATELFVYSPVSNNIEYFSESEGSRDILQTFTPLSSTAISDVDLHADLRLSTSRNSCDYIAEDANFPLNIMNETTMDTLENQLLEKIMDNVTNNGGLSRSGLDQFINSVASYDVENCRTEGAFSSHISHNENSFVVEHPDIVTEQTSSVLSLQTNGEFFGTDILYTDESFVVDHPVTVQSPESNTENILQNQNSLVVEQTAVLGECTSPLKTVEVLKEQPLGHKDTKKVPSSAPLVVKVQCADYSIDLELNAETSETLAATPNNSNVDLYTAADVSTIPLPDNLIHKMIELYRKFPQLWNPNHLDYNSRKLRRQAWCSLTTEFNTAVEKQLSWRTLHRKLTDYAKYYKKLITEQEDYEHLENKWTFYEDFKFMDDVIAVHNELQRSVHHRDNNFKIIAIYKTLPQLWNIKHPDYNKRDSKQRNIELMCNRLQEENNLQLTTERLKNRLIELRAQYRLAKKQRLKCLKNQHKFSFCDFDFYEALNFLDDHIDPFICEKCKMEFKKLTDYNQHLKREHSQKTRLKIQTTDFTLNGTCKDNICHICGLKFSTRSNLLHHVKRHEGIRNYECSMCPKKFYASHALKVHIRSHTKEYPYTCEKCGMSFVSASKLNQHVKRHLNRKDFACDFCPKAFFTAFEKDRHEKRHLNIRDKACPICGKAFVAGSSYYAHLMLHNDTKRFACDKCDMKFAQYAGLYKHKKRHH